MSDNRLAPIGLAVLLGGAAVYGLVRSRDDAPAPSPEPSANPFGLPPNHPPIGADGGLARLAEMRDEKPQIQWQMPASWSSRGGNATRLATYHVPAAVDATDDAEVSITRAGGTTDANIERWVWQFDESGKVTRSEKTVAGFKVTTVEVGGTYLANAMGPAEANPKKRWAMVGAIVETPGPDYFLKLVGPKATVDAERANFLGMVDGLTSLK